VVFGEIAARPPGGRMVDQEGEPSRGSARVTRAGLAGDAADGHQAGRLARGDHVVKVVRRPEGRDGPLPVARPDRRPVVLAHLEQQRVAVGWLAVNRRADQQSLGARTW